MRYCFFCRGDYRSNAFYPSRDGSRYMLLDKFGEMEIEKSDYDRLIDAEGEELQQLLRDIIGGYDLQGSRARVRLNGDVDKLESVTLEQAEAYTEESAVAEEGMDVFGQETARAEAAETFRQYYLSYLEGINGLDGNLISYCTPNHQARQEKRIWDFNSENTFENLRMLLDEDSVVFVYEDGVPTVRFTVRCENDMWWRDNSGPKELNTAIQQTVVQYSQERGGWEVTCTLLDNSVTMGSNLTGIE